MLVAAYDRLCSSGKCTSHGFSTEIGRCPRYQFHLHSWNWRRLKCKSRTYPSFKASLISNPHDFEVGRFIGSYGFMNITSYSSFQSGGLSNSGRVEGMDLGYSSEDIEKLRVQDVGEGQVKIRLYEGRVSQGPLRGTRVIFKVYPGHRAGGIEADMMAANELNTHAFLQGDPGGICKNVQLLLGGFETKTGEQWLAFRNDGKYSAADYARIKSEAISKDCAQGEQKFWNPFDQEQKIKGRRLFVINLLRGAISGLAYMHSRDRLHQSLGPASVVLNTIAEKDVAYLIPRLRDLAFSVDISYSSLGASAEALSEGLWHRASSSGALTPMEKKSFGIADDIYEAGLLFAYLAFIPFCEAGAIDGLSLQGALVGDSLTFQKIFRDPFLSVQRLFESTFQLDLEAAREYCQADDRLLEAVKFLDLGDGAGWELLQTMLNPDFRQRPIAEAVLNHRFMTGAVL